MDSLQVDRTKPSSGIFIRALFCLMLLSVGIRAIDSSNKMCNGDFQEYGLVSAGYVYAASNFSCWYAQDKGVMEVKLRTNPIFTSAICELVHSSHYILCQNLTLLPKKQYQLNFTVFNSEIMTSSTIILLINNKNILNHTTINQMNISQASNRFMANQTSSMMCFDSVYTGGYAYVGPAVDNVTLVRLSPDEDSYQIFCTTKMDYLNWEVSISCQYASAEIEYYLNMLRKYINFYISGIRQEVSEITSLNSTLMKVRISPNSEFSLQTIAIEIDKNNGVNVPVPEFIFEVDGLPVTFTKQKDSQTNILKDMYSISQTIITTTEKVYVVLKSCVASYFLINIINFWNLSLMYNVLNISTIPAFSKYFLEKLTFLFFNLNSLSQWVEENVPVLKNRLSFEKMQGREFIDDTKNNYAWFGSFGISSNFIQNNFQTLFLILVMIIKILLVLLLRKIPLLQKILPQKSKLLKIFLLQVISMETFMVMSAAASLFNLNSINSKQKFNNFLQIMNAFICLMVVAGYFIVSIKVSVEKKLQKWKKTHQVHQILLHKQTNPKTYLQYSKKLSKHRNRARVTEFNTIFQLIPIITVPSLILTNNPPIFLLVTTLILLHRLYYFRKNVGQFLCKVDGKIFDGFNILFWAVLQVCYVVLWVLERIVQGRGGLKGAIRDNVYTCVKIIGFVIVFTVLIGGLFQILRFFIQCLKLVFKLLKIVIKKYKKYSRITPVAENPPQTLKKHKNSRLARIQIINESSPFGQTKNSSDSNNPNHSHSHNNYLHSSHRNKLKVTIIKAQEHRRQKQLKIQKSGRSRFGED